MPLAKRGAVLGIVLVSLPVWLQAAPGVLHLADAEKVALERQPTMRQAQAQTQAAAARAITARAPMLPQLDAQASYQRVRSSNVGRATAGTTAPGTTTSTSATAGSTDPSGSNVWSLGANATQLLWDFGQSYRKYQAAEETAQATEAQQRVSMQTVILDVRHTYFAARAQKELLAVAKDALANQQRHLEQITGFVQAGTRPEIDVAQAKTDVANARVQVINAENAYALARAQLSRAMGDPSAMDSRDVGDDELASVAGEELPAEHLTAHGLQDRPELVALTRQREAQTLTLRGLKGGYGPTLSARGSYQQIGSSLDGLGPAWSVGVVLDWPFFQGGLTTGQVREAEANLAATDAQLEAQRLQIAIDVHQAQLALRNAKATQEATKEVVANAQERLRLAEGRYAQGVGSVIELGDAQLALTQANAQLVQAKFNVSSARADLLAAMGQR